MKTKFNESDQKTRKCFIDKTRICKVDCMSAFQAEDKAYCAILWSINNLGHCYEKIYLEKSAEKKKSQKEEK